MTIASSLQLVAARAQQNADESSANPEAGAPDVDDSTAFNLRGDINVQAMQETGVLLIEGNEEDLERICCD